MTILLIVVGTVVCLPLAWWVARLGDARSASTLSKPVSRDEAGVRLLAEAGDTIGAIKLYRELSGLGLKESRDAVEALIAGRGLPARPAPAPSRPLADPAGDAEIRRLVSGGQLIDAIKRYRKLTGAGLKDAKDAIERMAR